MSYADEVFIKNCKDILENGIWDTGEKVRPKWDDGSPAHTIKRFALVNRYDLTEEFPLMTLRKINYKAAVDEILWIYQKKSNKIADLNSKIWNAWADEEGTIGKAYGYQLGIKHKYPEGEFDQVDRILWDLKNDPQSRRIISNLFNHSQLHEMALAPCAYSLTLNVSGNRLNAILNQRSQDMLVANNWNVCQYGVLLMMFAQVSGFQVGELVHVIADAHIYDRHVDYIKEIISRKPFSAPKFSLAKEDDFYNFTADSFKVEDYKFHEFKTRIPVAI